MMIELPALRIEEKFHGNNIVHLIDNKLILESYTVSRSRSQVNIEANGLTYIIIKNKDITPDGDYILLSKRLPSQEDINNNILHIKQWIKHPKLSSYLPQDIVNNWNGCFNFKEEDLAENIRGLRKPQIGAIHKILGHFTNADDIGTIVLPTGTGKTETMLSVLIANKCSKLLITVPSDSLRTQLANKFISLGLLKQNGNVSNDTINPIVGILNKKFSDANHLNSFFQKCNVIVSTMDIVSGSFHEEKIVMSDLCSHLFIDEAHHSKATEWNKLISYFDKNKVIQFTATPFRNDGKILDGKIIYNFSLKDAQDQGYFKEIDFLPIREYDRTLADIKIADKAVEKLRADIANGYNHILMARCLNHKRAERVFSIYSQFPDLEPVLIHSKIPNLNVVREDIVNKKHRIIVCVDMLGEGFDLPELKIAAFHDIRKSLPITLQFAGRFTRTSRDSNLGNASFIANLVQDGINDELSLLYSKDSNWNTILPSLSLQATQQQVDLQTFLHGFSDLEESKIPFQNISPPFSTVVYKKESNTWFPNNFEAGISNYDQYDHKFFSLNRENKTLVILLGSRHNVNWGTFSDIYNIEWDIFIIHWDTVQNLLFIHSSEKNGNYEKLASAVTDNDATLLSGINVFRVFYEVKRLMLYNVGLRRGQGKDISFQSYYGGNIRASLSSADINSNIKNNIFGVGHRDGEKISIGCSRKGRIWSYLRGNMQELTVWFKDIGKKLIDESIDPNEVLKGTLEPKKISTRPLFFPYYVDWAPLMYKEIESRFEFQISGDKFDLANCELALVNPTDNGELKFSLSTENSDILFKINLTDEDFAIEKLSNVLCRVTYGNKTIDATEFFHQFPPRIGFVNNSILDGDEYIEFNEDILRFPKENISTISWDGVDLNRESIGFHPRVLTSIQYAFVTYLKNDNNKFDIIYNDDNKGEIADIVAIKNNINEIEVDLYHLKFAINGVVSNDINNLYQVCGQTQKSLNWYFRENKELINHLLKRELKKQSVGQTRLEKGDINELENILNIVKNHKPIKFRIFIVQPGFSKQHVSNSILDLLAVTANHLKIMANIDLKVISSE
ncbi:DEAD/DEAH box helicase [Flavobacterium zepuense]|uniref:DEAD/DEAH box helicase n=1 Tax=Flavobacterium zepuense TaxID=2593302 RepID=A0A552VAK1_9FLAO|nr:DEAD/DEAH box helicase family protein [Flavobacterium zepuense]TRW27502.1 DEAD/DEAH box helicase [Flavobacterium zepuense]